MSLPPAWGRCGRWAIPRKKHGGACHLEGAFVGPCTEPRSRLGCARRRARAAAGPPRAAWPARVRRARPGASAPRRGLQGRPRESRVRPGSVPVGMRSLGPKALAGGSLLARARVCLQLSLLLPLSLSRRRRVQRISLPATAPLARSPSLVRCDRPNALQRAHFLLFAVLVAGASPRCVPRRPARSSLSSTRTAGRSRRTFQGRRRSLCIPPARAVAAHASCTRFYFSYCRPLPWRWRTPMGLAAR